MAREMKIKKRSISVVIPVYNSEGTIFSLVERLGVVPEFAVTGGMAKNRGVMDRLMPMIKLDRMKTEWDAQIAGAIGAGLFGYALCQRGKGRKK